MHHLLADFVVSRDGEIGRAKKGEKETKERRAIKRESERERETETESKSMIFFALS